MPDLMQLVVGPDATVRDVMECIDRNTKGIALVTEPAGRLIATITDGDVRRALLAGVATDATVQTLIDRKAEEPFLKPVTAQVGTGTAELIHLMNELSLRHVPIVDDEERVVGLAVLSDLMREYELPLTAIVMAGGFGTRLRPLTEETPKPMLPVGGRPLLEHVIEGLRASGIRRVNVTTHFRADVIAEHFGDGARFGVAIEYVNEDEPLGTAGALSLLGASNEPLLVMNGDILTGVNFRAMLDFHREHAATMTIAVRQLEFQIPYGIVNADGPRITGIVEKPTLKHYVNAGIYLLDPSVRAFLPDRPHFDMPEVVERLIAAGAEVISFPVSEYWADIGQMAGYEQAERDVQAGKLDR